MSIHVGLLIVAPPHRKITLNIDLEYASGPIYRMDRYIVHIKHGKTQTYTI